MKIILYAPVLDLDLYNDMNSYHSDTVVVGRNLWRSPVQQLYSSRDTKNRFPRTVIPWFCDLSWQTSLFSFFSLKDPVPSGFSAGDVLIPLADEYDPMFPNDYEKVVKRQREERQRQRELERQKEIEEREK